MIDRTGRSKLDCCTAIEVVLDSGSVRLLSRLPALVGWWVISLTEASAAGGVASGPVPASVGACVEFVSLASPFGFGSALVLVLVLADGSGRRAVERAVSGLGSFAVG